ncbi:hypothetical protein N8I77_001524 [Diaporthe amygdali]|uniref:Uncharacterized protein n=1 Tax=Phomopsis amygdali TaxID=1214568 RepID=A0AAD9WAW4_PHOAM|nr:hypothetical protein N8I77_001524 [Diaporthe amygdali]
MAPRPFRLVVGIPRDDTIELLTPTTAQPQSVAPMTARYQPERIQGDSLPESCAYHGRSDVEVLMSRKLRRSRETNTSQEGIWDSGASSTDAAIDSVTGAATGAAIDAAIDAVIGVVIGVVIGAATDVVIDAVTDGLQYVSKYVGGGRNQLYLCWLAV